MNDQSQNLESGLAPMGPQDYSEIEDWPGYFASVLGKGARDTLLFALNAFEKEGLSTGYALDLAAGEGRDTLELLQRNWRVVATDGHPDAFTFLCERVPEALKSNLTTVVVSFDKMQIPESDLVNASFALPFCAPRHFPRLWKNIVSALESGGRFAGQFFGDRDSWATMPGRSHQSKEEILKLLEGFEIEMMREEERDDSPDIRKPKHWHIFHIVARKL